MKKFLNYILLFLLPISILVLIEGLLPISTFTNRHYEAVTFMSNVFSISSMYPNVNSTMSAVGDLCHHTPNAISKKESWISDKLGFRNNQFFDKADILLIGDSFIQGSSLDQEDILSNKIMKMKPNLKVYNMASSSISEFDKLLKLGIIQKPKVLIFSNVERELPSKINNFNLDGNSKLKYKLELICTKFGYNVFVDKISKHFFINWLKSRLNNKKGDGIKSSIHSKMFFLNGIKQEYKKERRDISISRIYLYKKYCDSLGIRFIYLPMPNKETVYYDLVPFSIQPQNLRQIDSILKIKKIESINTLDIYNKYRRQNSNLIYHLDDTHWNSNATRLISEKICQLIR